VEAVRRSAADRSYLFLINHTDRTVTVQVDGAGPVTLPPGDATVVAEHPHPGTSDR
jgi:beta-galactosidase